MDMRMGRSRVQAYFRDEAHLSEAVEALTDAAFAPELIHVGIVDPDGYRPGLHLIYYSGDMMGAILGAVAGAVLGMGVALVVVYDLLQIAWLDAFLDVGLGRALFRGGVVGAAVVGLWGGIVGFGWWKEVPPTDPAADLYVVTVDTADRASQARGILSRYSDA